MSERSKSYHRFVFLLFGLSVVWALFSVPAQAVEVSNLYQATAPVPDQSRQARFDAQKVTLSKVMVKVSGNHNVLDNPAVKAAVRKANQYLTQYTFTRDEAGDLLFEGSFDEGKINQLLRRESLPIWGKRRPSILLWMAGEDADSGNRQVLSKEAYTHLQKQIKGFSDDRGLPILFPLYDLEDTKKVSVSDVWGYFYNHISQFSYRYNTDAILLSRFWQEPPVADENGLMPEEGPEQVPWKLQWRLYEKDELTDANTIEGELPKLIEQLVHQMADRYALEYAVDSSNYNNASRITLTVSNVGQLEYLIEAEKLLGSFSAVADVLLTNINNDVAEFEIALIGQPLDLLQGLELESHFEKIFDPLAERTEEQPMNYRWKP